MIRLAAVRPFAPLSTSRAALSAAALAFGLALTTSACPSPAPQPVGGDGEGVVHADPPRLDKDGNPVPDPRYAELARRANDAAAAGRFDEALARADEALRVRPFGLAAGVAKVEAHLALGHRTVALDYAERLHDRHPDRPEAAYARGKALYALSRLYDARDAFEAGLARAPGDRGCMLGALLASAHDPETPLQDLEARAAELTSPLPDGRPSPEAPDALHALAIARELRHDFDAADQLYERAIAARAHHPFAHYNLAQLRRARAGMSAARPHFVAFLDQAPPSAVREVDAVKKLLQETRP